MSFRRQVRTLVLLISVLVLVVGTTGLIWFTSTLPRLPNDLNQLTAISPTELYDRNGQRLSSLEGRVPVPLKDISPYFRKAVLAAEDKNFYLHSGIDKIAIVRASFNMAVRKKHTQSGSTITQQLVKNLFFSFAQTWQRKLKEVFMAMQLEQMFSKDKIFEGYCNSVYFGLGAYGVEAGAQAYFSKRASELTLAQSAMLAGLPNAPSRLNPFRYPERARQRMAYILGEMVSNGFVTEDEAQRALSDSIKLRANYPAATGVAYFQDYLMDRLEGMLTLDQLYAGGLQINTTLDFRLQSEVQQILRRKLDELEKTLLPVKGNEYSPTEPLQGAAVVLDSRTNEILVMVGGRDYTESQFNRATSNNRPPGSSFKPFTYLTSMIVKGKLPSDEVTDDSLAISVDDTIWRPQNYDGKYHGRLVLKKALQLSLNTVAVRLIMEASPESVVTIAKACGITSPLHSTLSLALGATAVSPLEMAGAYGTIRRLGEWRDVNGVRSIRDLDGKLIYTQKPLVEKRIPPEKIFMLRDMMRGVVDGGTGYPVRKAGFKGPCAGKTGTTNDNRDVWFIGFTPDYTAAIWVGHDDNRPLLSKNRKGWTGGDIVGPIFAEVMKAAYDNTTPGNFEGVTGFEQKRIPISGGDKDSITVLIPAMDSTLSVPTTIPVKPKDKP